MSDTLKKSRFYDYVWTDIYNPTASSLERDFLEKAERVAEFTDGMSTDSRLMAEANLLTDEVDSTARLDGFELGTGAILPQLVDMAGVSRSFKPGLRERAMVEFMLDVRENRDREINAERLMWWHEKIIRGRTAEADTRPYSSTRRMFSDENRPSSSKPPSMEDDPSPTQIYFDWFNDVILNPGESRLPMERAATAHAFFMSVNPFRFGGKMIGRALADIAISQSLPFSSNIMISMEMLMHREEYFSMIPWVNNASDKGVWKHFYGRLATAAAERTLLALKKYDNGH